MQGTAEAAPLRLQIRQERAALVPVCLGLNDYRHRCVPPLGRGPVRTPVRRTLDSLAASFRPRLTGARGLPPPRTAAATAQKGNSVRSRWMETHLVVVNASTTCGPLSLPRPECFSPP
ncbi:hypothetical protein GCM10009863_20020 [Streptomyces axinellae]|uniref:Uncharacterized protein n=1 Tax=Streptomyces axinellae TaxID=552788 RepID=A0ABN3PYL6_9ACTN